MGHPGPGPTARRGRRENVEEDHPGPGRPHGANRRHLPVGARPTGSKSRNIMLPMRESPQEMTVSTLVGGPVVIEPGEGALDERRSGSLAATHS